MPPRPISQADDENTGAELVGVGAVEGQGASACGYEDLASFQHLLDL